MPNKTANFTMPGMRAPVAADMEAEALQQAMLVKALQEQEGGLTAPPASTGRFLTLNLDPLANALRKQVTEGKLAASRKRSLDLEGRFAEEQARELRRFRTAEEGVDLPGPPTEDGTRPGVPANPKAFQDFQHSPYPQVATAANQSAAAYAEALKAETARETARLAELVKRASMPSLQNPALTPNQWKPKEIWDIKDGLPVLTQEGQVPRLGGAGWQEGRPTPQGARTIVNTFSGDTKAVGGGPLVSVSTGDKADTAILTTQGTAAAKNADKLRIGAPRMLAALTRAEEAAKAGALQGYAEPVVSAAASILTQLGLAPETVKQKLVNTEVIYQSMSESIRNALEAAGYNPSNLDLVFAQQGAGSARNTKEGLLSAIYAARAAMANEVLLHNANVKRLATQAPTLLNSLLPERQMQIPQFTFDPDAGLYRPRTVEDIQRERRPR